MIEVYSAYKEAVREVNTLPPVANSRFSYKSCRQDWKPEGDLIATVNTRAEAFKEMRKFMERNNIVQDYVFTKKRGNDMYVSFFKEKPCQATDFILLNRGDEPCPL